MGIRTFDEWANERAQVIPFSSLADTVIGFDAAHYLDRLLSNPPSKERLLSALGGYPFALKSIIEDELDTLKAANITPVFVFGGLDIVKRNKARNDLSSVTRASAQAWDFYDQNLADQAVEAFGNSGAVRPPHLYRFLQKILRAKGVEFQVAPYSAWAQLAYLENHPSQFVDAVAGSSELFLFNVSKILTKVDFEKSQFTWISRATCQEDLGKISVDTFVDALLLSGSAFLPTFPPLENPNFHRKPFNVRDAVSMMVTLGRSVSAVCTHYQDDAQVQQTDYLDNYRRGRMAVKHHVVFLADGKVEPLDVEHAPSDVHEFIGQRLPEELYFYLSKGVLSPRVLNWLTSGDIYEAPPMDNGESTEYRHLVRDQLTPLRMQALALLSQSLTRFYQRKEITSRFWFDKGNPQTTSLRDIPSAKDAVSSWKVNEGVLKNYKNEALAAPGSLGFEIRCLGESDFAKKSLSTTGKSEPLKSKDEILSNSLWRFLYLREYVDDKHNLTSWGKALHATIASLKPEDHLEEAAFIAIELLRLSLLNANEMFPSYSGAPMRGSDTDKRNTLLVSRLACLGKLRHKAIGFTGPLSRHLLAYNSIVAAVRGSLRDLVDISVVTLLLNGNADRDRDDWTDLGLDLPFVDDNDCGLGIAVKSYLDELSAQTDPTSPSVRADIKDKAPRDWFWHVVDFSGDLDIAFRLWDAVFNGVKAAGTAVQDADLWSEVDAWLADRR